LLVIRHKPPPLKFGLLSLLLSALHFHCLELLLLLKSPCLDRSETTL